MKQVDHFMIIQIESKNADLGLKLFTQGAEKFVEITGWGN